MIVRTVDQHSLQFADRDCWTLGRFWNHGLVPRYDVFSSIRPQPLETAKIVQEGWTTGIVTVLGDSQGDLRGLQQDNAGQHPHNKAEANLDFAF